MRAPVEAGDAGAAPPRPERAGSCPTTSASVALTSASRAVCGMPETFVGTPAVIAWTTSCCVVFARSKTPTFRPRRRTVMRVAVSKMSCRLCEMITTARPCSASRLTSASTCSVWATPSAAVGSSRITSFEFHCTALATATDCRWPPESDGDRLADRVDRRDGERLQRLGRLLLHDRLLQPLEPVVLLAAEIHVLHDVEVVAEREILVDDLDAELRGVLRPVDVHLFALEQDLAAVGGVRARDAFDQRRLAGAVVADEGHDLAAPHLEVDVGQRLHRAERLRDASELKERGLVHRRRVSYHKGRWRRPVGRLHRQFGSTYLQYCL